MILQSEQLDFKGIKIAFGSFKFHLNARVRSTSKSHLKITENTAIMHNKYL